MASSVNRTKILSDLIVSEVSLCSGELYMHFTVWTTKPVVLVLILHDATVQEQQHLYF